MTSHAPVDDVLVNFLPVLGVVVHADLGRDVTQTRSRHVHSAPHRDCTDRNAIANTRLAHSASRVKKVSPAKSSGFPTNSCKFPTTDIMGAQNYNLVR